MRRGGKEGGWVGGGIPWGLGDGRVEGRDSFPVELENTKMSIPRFQDIEKDSFS